ncbi:TetR family transcriptional regulator [Actinomadura sp. LD22]|uniref:TetR family transcriptional regulator n=1 Tax=Actinomadura physcomitrii TaxID=2650748 RepID=A0A6I4M9M9_9ACTN|nr:TetR/AcrR family transcriptional regulator [Actinomadura physcomitrii]MWA01630.1 TetR family transcriptional regulator [Actinomadura physcomitrii]
MARMSTPPRGRPGRPVDPEIDSRVLSAALEVYSEVGWAGFTMNAVARRGGVGKAALYRRWPTRQDLFAAAINSLRTSGPVEITGSLYRDLTQTANRLINRFLGPHGMASIRALVDAKIYPDELGEALDYVRQSTIIGGRKIVLAAVDSGELPPDVSPSLIMDALAGTLVHRILLIPDTRRAQLAANPEPLVAQVVDLVLRGVGWQGTVSTRRTESGSGEPRTASEG